MPTLALLYRSSAINNRCSIAAASARDALFVGLKAMLPVSLPTLQLFYIDRNMAEGVNFKLDITNQRRNAYFFELRVSCR